MLLHLIEENANLRLGVHSATSGEQFQLMSESLAGATTLSQALDIIGGIVPDGLEAATKQFLDQWPSAVQAAAVATIRHCFAQSDRLPITVCWQPSYEYGLDIIQAEGSSSTPPRVTLLFRSRYATDDRPRLDVASSSN